MFLIQFLIDIDETLLWSNPPRPHVSHAILIEIVENLLWRITPLQACSGSILIQSIDDNPPWSIPLLREPVSYSVIMRNWRKSSLKYPSFSKACFLSNSSSNLMKISVKHPSSSKAWCIQNLFEIDNNSLCSILPLPNHVSYSALTQKWWKSFPN